MAIVVTMEVGPVDWTKFKAAIDWSKAFPAAGRASGAVYRAESDPNTVLLVEEWESHDKMHAYQNQIGEEFNERAGTGSLEWKDTVWQIAEQL